MLRLLGSPALSRFRLEKILAEHPEAGLKAHQIEARFVHFVHTRAALSDAHKQVLERLLDYGPASVDVDNSAPATFTVLPRLGTISPWSSKATDIAHNCGLEHVVRMERGIEFRFDDANHGESDLQLLGNLFHDRMTEVVIRDEVTAGHLFDEAEPRALEFVPLMAEGRTALERANKDWGLALSSDELDYLDGHFNTLARDPSDVELMMFAQANSEHCRHKIFNADWTIDGKAMDKTLFQMIRNTHEKSPHGVLSAYTDNSAVMAGHSGKRFFCDAESREYAAVSEDIHVLMKVETHNHPTAISPFPGAATGSGGEIRDEGATGRGAKPKAGLAGFSVSNLRIPDYPQPWETPENKPGRIASPLQIMLEGPIGAAAFNNEFGRPNLCGYFRTLEQPDGSGTTRGYHKPIMVAGGMGNIRAAHVHKCDIPADANVVVIGGPAMLIGLGGGAASSMTSGQSEEDLDFASVQRGNPEIQRRAQEVIDRCWEMGEDNPILLVHDVGAGGLSNAVPESIDHSGLGGTLDLREVPNLDPGMSPMEIWCNEAQERYVLIILPERQAQFDAICLRERCPVAVLGQTHERKQLTLSDPLLKQTPVDIPMDVLLGKTPRTLRDTQVDAKHTTEMSWQGIELDAAIDRVLSVPAVADKSFLITIGDRSVGGLCARDQMVGPWQTPVADVAVTVSDFDGYHGEAMAMGEKTPLAMIDPAASGRMAVVELITNMMAADIDSIADIRLSANWMAAANHSCDDADLYATVRTVGEEFCPALGIAIPVGKDSLSMKSNWTDTDGQAREVVAPISLIVSGFAAVNDVRKTLTPQLQDIPGSELILVDFGGGLQRMGGSVLAMAYQQMGGAVADVSDPAVIAKAFNAIKALKERGVILSYHDRSDGGLIATVLEMAFAGRTGVKLRMKSHGEALMQELFNEEAGCVLQCAAKHVDLVLSTFAEQGIPHLLQRLGTCTAESTFVIAGKGETVFQKPLLDLHKTWSATSYHMQRLRDNPQCTDQEYSRFEQDDPGLQAKLSFDPNRQPFIATGAKPRIAVLREQGVNGQIEMAAAFDRAGFKAVDVHMSDLIGGASLRGYSGLAACGGFSYGDVLGAGEGWAKSILYNARVRREFRRFFADTGTFTLGVCNGCQMLSTLKELIPGADNWPRFVRNLSEQYEARVCSLELLPTTSIMLQGMQGSVIPVVVAHGEGRAEFESERHQQNSTVDLAARYVDNHAAVTEIYPLNPNGSPGGAAAYCSTDGRATIMMPHPERVFRTVQHSWHPDSWQEDSPWMRMFRNAREWVSGSA